MSSTTNVTGIPPTRIIFKGKEGDLYMVAIKDLETAIAAANDCDMRSLVELRLEILNALSYVENRIANVNKTK